MYQVSDRLFCAVRTLAGDGTHKQRLVRAYVEHIEPIRADDVPGSIRTPFDALRRAMTAVPATERETSVQVSVRKMSPDEVARHTRSLVMMFSELVRVHQTGERLLSSPQDRRRASLQPVQPAVRVPTFLALG